MSTLSNLTLIVYGINIMSFQSAPNDSVRLALGYTILSSLIAAAMEMAVTLIVAPRWAERSLRDTFSQVCVDLGHVRVGARLSPLCSLASLTHIQTSPPLLSRSHPFKIK